MQYSEGHIGRIFLLKIENGEDFLAVTKDFIRTKSVHTGAILFLGALERGRLVTGPENLVIPPEPHYVMFEGGWEMVGFGTIYQDDNGPSIHYHASVGRAGHALTGCLREKAITYIVAEAVVLEFAGMQIYRRYDEKTGVSLPVHKQSESSANKPTETIPSTEPLVPQEERQKDEEDLPGGLAEIIRDLTRRPRG